ncbi:MAG TPA: high-potential iron-sulfur protein [Candidatus Binatia bacterium]|nr:high-potential iron-sulfur protein [Candidatus Binatia bacterium]
MRTTFGPPTRGRFLRSAILLPALASLAGAAALADSSKASPASMRYQTSPNGSMQCSGCKFFIPGQDAKSSGSCQIVDGSISPSGYCIAYVAK